MLDVDRKEGQKGALLVNVSSQVELIYSFGILVYRTSETLAVSRLRVSSKTEDI
jgi:hypothetical protein